MRLAPILILLVFAQGLQAVPDFEREVWPFLKQHCYSCHDAKKAKAGFRIDELGTDFLSGKTADAWHEVINQINSGEMPPKKEPRPDAKAAFAVVEWVGANLKNAERQARMASGRNVPEVSIKADDLAPLATMTKLGRPAFERISFPAAAFAPLKAHATLEGIGLTGCEAAAGALTPLAQLPNLKVIEGRDSKADPADISAIKTAKPKLRVTGF